MFSQPAIPADGQNSGTFKSVEPTSRRHFRVYQSLDIIKHHSWKLSSNLLEREDFLIELPGGSLHVSESLLTRFAKENSQLSLIGVMERRSLQS